MNKIKLTKSDQRITFAREHKVFECGQLTFEQLQKIVDDIVLPDDTNMEINFGKADISLVNYAPNRLTSQTYKSATELVDVNNYCSVKIDGVLPLIHENYFIENISNMKFRKYQGGLYKFDVEMFDCV